jgi:NTE family protein
MTVEQFTTNNAKVEAILEELSNQIGDKIFSDVVDDEGHQYIDLVMEGGGMLGIALVGYVYVLEKIGLRFLQIGGTSAGAINALLMASAGPKDKESTKWILEIMANKNFYDFVDGDSDAKNFIDAVTERGSLKKLIWHGAQVVDNLRDDFGLNPGQKFHEWLTYLLKENKVDTLEKLENLRLQGNEQLKLRDGRLYISKEAGRIALIAADITTQTKVNFPAMADLYWAEPKQVNPADFVRASMSIPFFFYPYKIKNLPSGSAQFKKWRHVGYTGNIPNEVMFIDGGINSNFPIDVFHDHTKIPSAPTFGVKLGVDRNEPRIVNNLPGLIGAIFDSSRHVHDFDFIIKNPDYRHLVQCLDTDSFNWLDFKMPDEMKLRLFEVGVKGAADFLIKFDWKKYKDLRKAIVSLNIDSDKLKHKSDERLASAAVSKLLDQ